MREHLDDLASDFSAIHRVDDIRKLSGPAFFRFAFRLGAYQGVIAARMMEQQQEEAPAGAQGQSWGRGTGREVNPGTRESLQALQAQLSAADPVNTPTIFSFGTLTRQAG